MNYLRFDFTVQPTEPGNEILIALLGDAGFESFNEHANGFEAFVQEENLDRSLIPDPSALEGVTFTFTEEKVESKNWNEEWEKNFSPVLVEDKCCIRAAFHAPCENVKLEVVITPKMSFGTGHHDTTWLMTRELFNHDMKGKSVMDMGCGTGVLAIVAKKLGAKHVVGVDIDDWSVENAIENCEVNSVSEIKIMKGDSSVLNENEFDVILANINRNVLLKDIPVYAKSLRESGLLLLSGFFESDIPSLIQKAEDSGLKKVKSEVKNGWGMLTVRR